ncbi:MAG: ubiquinone/menaquinone biosynthesis methyltransferase [Actinomycetota bacterium]
MSRVAPEPLPVGEEKVRAVREMFDTIAPRYDLLNRILTFGMDISWRRRTVQGLRLPKGSLVLDLACGTGDLCRELRMAGYRAVGFDNSAGMLAAARTRVPLLLADALSLPVRAGEADGITCGFALRNVADLGRLFSEMARVLRPGGRIGLLETAQPEAALPRLLHRLYFYRVVPIVGGLLSDRAAYTYLPRSSAYLPEAPELIQMLRSCGFATIARRRLGLGAAQLVTGTKG